MWRHRPALQYILRIEVRALAIRRGNRVHHGQLLLLPQARHEIQRGMQREEIIEAMQVVGLRDAELATQPCVVRIAHRRHGSEPIQRATQQHEHEAALAGVRAGEAHLRCEHAAAGSDAPPRPRNAGVSTSMVHGVCLSDA